ncbi:rod shape-determining protein [Candidatus Saccharibacteria bacterium]|nr:rod shape-determining protein [Candidatus Saccharibacteria bacterium]MCB9834822.1 rod shape-determining protein [Candidatus Nomurabacteria bacterium]
MLNKLLSKFSHDIGIDLGTANTLVYLRGRGLVIDEPSVVAINQKTKQILEIGQKAKQMVGKTPANIVATRPLVDGVVSDFEITEQMIKHFIELLHKQNFALLPRPRVVIGIPSGVTEVEKRAVIDAAANAGARQAFLIEEPMAAAIGVGLEIQEATGQIIVDIGGGTSEVAVISLGGIVASQSLRIAGDELTNDIVNYAKEEFGLLVGERTAEEIKIEIGSACNIGKLEEASIRGRDIITGLPKELIITPDQAREAISKSVRSIVESVKITLEETPPELISDIMRQGIWLAGGGALLKGLDQVIARETGIPVHIGEDPLRAVVRGTGLVLDDLDNLSQVLVGNDLGQEYS